MPGPLATAPQHDAPNAASPSPRFESLWTKPGPYAASFRYTDRETKARYVAAKYAPILRHARRVLDVGCDAKQLCTFIEGDGRYVGIDRNPLADHVVDLEQGKIPFGSGSFDTVVCLDVLEHLARCHDVFDELCRVSRDRIIISLPNPVLTLIQNLFDGRPDHLKYYGLPVEPPADRHRWFFGFEEAAEFLTRRGERNGFEIEQLDAEYVSGLYWKLGREPVRDALDHPNLKGGTCWCVLKRRHAVASPTCSGSTETRAGPGTKMSTVEWPQELIDADLGTMVAAWQRSLHGFVKRLPPEKMAKFAMALDSAVYSIHGESAVVSNGGLHPKHEILGYHDWFASFLRPGETVIDLGSGVGALAVAMATKGGAMVTGMDWSQKNIDASKARCAHASPRPVFVTGDITRDRAPLPESGRFDTVVLSNVLEHIDRRVERLRQWTQWYKPSRFLIRVPAIDRDWRVQWKKSLGVEWRCDPTHETEYTKSQLQAELIDAGLTPGAITAAFGEYWLCATVRESVAELLGQADPGLSHEAYVTLQLERSKLMSHYDPGERTLQLGRKLVESLAGSSTTAAARPERLLCVGCRNGHELDRLESLGFRGLVGVDLHSTDPRIRVMDMQNLNLPDRSFDVVFASHCLEHALNPCKAASEFRRVVGPGGLIVVEVPVGGGRRGADLWDFRDGATVRSLFEPCEVLWHDRGRQIGSEKQLAERLILRVQD